MKRLLIAAAAALAVAAPASAATIDTSHSMRASGTVLSDKTTGTTGFFRVNLRLGPGHKVSYTDMSTGTKFHSLKITMVHYTKASEVSTSGWAVKIKGIGLWQGKRVPFTAIAVDHPARLGTDIFRISWGHGASLGGKLQAGGIVIVQL